VREATIATEVPPTDDAPPGSPSTELDVDIEAHIRLALATWPEIDPEVEGIVTRIAKANRFFDTEARATLARGGTTKEEFKVLLALRQSGSQSHGYLCRKLNVSTGAMTNRLDKLERTGLLVRSRDPHDRRGVLLELTELGRQKLDDYVNTGATRERELLGALSASERQQLNRLLQKLVSSLAAEVG
jgi:DNA-binding MarR family transcriptional regulator